MRSRYKSRITSALQLFLLFLFLISQEISPQYTPDDYSLIKTTYLREFNKDILNKYLTSNSAEKVKAALLSISHSEDTTFADEIIKLNFNEYNSYICFALGQIGRSEKAVQFLLDKILDDKMSKADCLNALGKIATHKDLSELLNLLRTNNVSISAGVSRLIANYVLKGEGLRELENSARKILLEEIKNTELAPSRRAEALFAYSRAVASSLGSMLAVQLLTDDSGNYDSTILIKQYTLASFRKSKFFPADFDLLKKLLRDKNWFIRCETIKVIPFYNFKSEKGLNLLIELLKDENPNVSRQAAISIGSIIVQPELKNYFKQRLFKILSAENLTNNTIGELFVSFTKLFEPELIEFAKELEGRIENRFIYRALGQSYSNSEAVLKYLLAKLDIETPINRSHIIDALINLQSRVQSSETLNKTLMKFISSSAPAEISIAADGLDSVRISQNGDSLKKIIQSQTLKYLNNADYIESLISLSNLAFKIDTIFGRAINHQLMMSELYSIKKYAHVKSGSKLKIIKNEEWFEAFWKNVFSYKLAKVKTTKGEIIIKFLPQFAPITVGNFILLARENFFNGLKFHRVVPGFVIQTGDSTATGWGGPGYEIISEFSPNEFIKNAVGMASAGKDTEGSQWFVMQGYYPHLNGRYSLFAEAISGEEAIASIDEGDKIISVELID